MRTVGALRACGVGEARGWLEDVEEDVRSDLALVDMKSIF